MPPTTLTPGDPGRDRPPRAGRHHGRHPELQERRDDRLRRPRGAGRARPVLPGAASRSSSTPTPASPDGTQRVVVETEPPDYVESILLVRPTQQARARHPDLSRDRRRRRQGRRAAHDLPDRRGPRGPGAGRRRLRPALASSPSGSSCWPGPILKGGFDFVAPLYSRYKYDGTITNTVTYPLTRALYGLRIRQPIGGDFGVSGDLVRHYLELDDWTEDISKFGIDIWMTTTAITGGFAVCQTRLGAKVHDPKDPGSDLGPMFSQVVGTILRLAAAHADALARVARLARRAGLRLRADHRPAAARGERDPPAVASSTRARSRSPTPGAGRWRRPTSRSS